MQTPATVSLSRAVYRLLSWELGDKRSRSSTEEEKDSTAGKNGGNNVRGKVKRSGQVHAPVWLKHGSKGEERALNRSIRPGRETEFIL